MRNSTRAAEKCFARLYHFPTFFDYKSLFSPETDDFALCQSSQMKRQSALALHLNCSGGRTEARGR
jgi:hypothetical protein